MIQGLCANCHQGDDVDYLIRTRLGTFIHPLTKKCQPVGSGDKNQAPHISPIVENSTKDNPTFKSGAKRSTKMLPYSMVPRDAMAEIAKRYQAGQDKGYGLNNWMQALGTEDVEYVRQFVDHIGNHEANFLLHVGDSSLDDDGETALQNAAAAAWGWIAIITYLLRDPGLVQRAFPKGAPNV